MIHKRFYYVVMVYTNSFDIQTHCEGSDLTFRMRDTLSPFLNIQLYLTDKNVWKNGFCLCGNVIILTKIFSRWPCHSFCFYSNIYLPFQRSPSLAIYSANVYWRKLKTLKRIVSFINFYSLIFYVLLPLSNTSKHATWPSAACLLGETSSSLCVS